MDELCVLSIDALAAEYRARRISPVEVIEAYAARVGEVDTRLNAFMAVRIEEAVEEARAAERALASGEQCGPLAGIPFAAKDIFDTAGLRTTYGSALFRDHVPEADATAVRRLREAGAILLGKTATHEFAWGITTDNPHFGPTRNPWRPERVPGGSSGGSAVAVATGAVPFALGSDTGGSIRIPAAFCGVVGLKPTWGRASVAGVFPLARSLDHLGVIARTAPDALVALAAVSGRDPRDPAAVPRGAPELESRDGGLDGLRVAICADLHRPPPEPDVRAAYDAAVSAAAEAGADIVEVRFPGAETILDAYATIQLAEALDSHTRARLWPIRRNSYGADVRARLDVAGLVTLAKYLAACEERRRVAAAFAAVFASADLLLTPVSAVPPPEIGAHAAIYEGRRVPFRDVVMAYTSPHNLAGIPACTVRAGFDALGIPVAVQLAGPAWSEAAVARAAHALAVAMPDVQAPWPALAA